MVIQLIGIRRPILDHHLLRIFTGEVSKKVKKSELNRFQSRWLYFPLRRHSVLAEIQKVRFLAGTEMFISVPDRGENIQASATASIKHYACAKTAQLT